MNQLVPLARSYLNIQGPDRYDFLQGLITQDIALLHKQPAIYTAMLSSQGRCMYDFFIVNRDDTLLIDIDSLRVQDLKKALLVYKLRSDVTLTDVSHLNYGAAFIGDETVLDNDLQDYSYTDPRSLQLGVRLIVPQAMTLTFDYATTTYNHHRLALGIPDGVQDMVQGKSIPLEFGLDELNAVSWTKGCYLGQELTARTKHVGVVRKHIFPAYYVGNPPLYGTKIYKNDNLEACGETLSHQEDLILCRLKLESLRNNDHEFIYDGGTLTVFVPEWHSNSI